MTRLNKWDQRFMELASFIAQWSKDPSTKCGCVIADSKNRIVSLGFNGLPRSVEDHEGRLKNRSKKYKLVIHAEENALMFANKPTDDCTAYVWPIPPCSLCAGKLIQAGISRVVSIQPTGERAVRWSDDLNLAYELYQEAGVIVDIE